MKVATKTVAFALMFASIYLGYRNIGSVSFWYASATQILTLWIAIGLSFWATQYQNSRARNQEREERKKLRQQEHAEEIVGQIQMIVSAETFYKITDGGNQEEKQKKRNELQRINRKMNNRINALILYGKILSFQDEAEYIQREFESYRDTIDEHLNDFDYLSKTEQKFRKNADNIDNKCNEIILKVLEVK
mgnify:CR=1 FL=1